MNKIPKVIHYCWFGKNEKSPLLLKCMKTWKEKFPNYQIKEWNEDNFDITQNIYIKEAYENKKWAFVSDYARLSIIYQYGGIYFDTDVEVIKNFEHLLINGGYLGFENTSNQKDGKTVATGLGFAAPPHDETIYAMLKDYENIHFIVNGKMDLRPCTVRNTESLIEIGLKPDGSMQRIGDITIYPYDYFCGYDLANSHPKITENTYTIHHYSALWKGSPSLKTRIKYGILIPVIQKIIGYKRYDYVKNKWLKRN